MFPDNSHSLVLFQHSREERGRISQLQLSGWISVGLANIVNEDWAALFVVFVLDPEAIAVGADGGVGMVNGYLYRQQ